MNVLLRGVAMAAFAVAVSGCSLLIDGDSGDDVDPEPESFRFPPDDRNLVMAGYRVVDLDIDGDSDVAIINQSTVPGDRGVFILLGGQPLSDLSYHSVVATPAAPAAISFADAIAGGEDGLDLFVVDVLGSLHVFTFVGGEQLYDPSPVSMELSTRPGPADKVSFDTGDFDGDGTIEVVVAVGDVGSTLSRIAPAAWTQPGLLAVEPEDFGRSLPFDSIAAVHNESGPDSVLLVGTHSAYLYSNGEGILDVETQDQSDEGCRYLEGVTAVADRVEGAMGSLAAARSGSANESGPVCITTVDGDSGEIVTLPLTSSGSAFPPDPRGGFEAIAFGDFAEGAAPEFVALDRSALEDSQVAAGTDVSLDAAQGGFFATASAVPQVMQFVNPDLLIPTDFDADGEGELWLMEADGGRVVCQRWAPSAEANLASCRP